MLVVESFCLLDVSLCPVKKESFTFQVCQALIQLAEVLDVSPISLPTLDLGLEEFDAISERLKGALVEVTPPGTLGLNVIVLAPVKPRTRFIKLVTLSLQDVLDLN